MHANSSTDRVWDEIRSTRSAPPAPAASAAERRKTYVSALEQAEQLLHAAAGVGPESSPVLVFYGLSQAGRAIAASASSVTSPDGWRLMGHGIAQVKGSLSKPLPDIPVYAHKPGNAGSFVRLSAVLGSPVWAEADALPLNAIWDTIPENRNSPLITVTEARRTPLQIEDRDLDEDPHPLVSVPVWPLPSWVVTADDPELLRRYMRAFPDAAGYDYPRRRYGPDATPDFRMHQDGWGELRMHWQVPNGSGGSLEDRLGLLKSMTCPYQEGRYFFPALGSNTTGLHPLMAWWAVLHTLSMLARYHPAEWRDYIDVDASRQAVPLTRLLRESIDILPRLIMETIRDVAAP